MCPLDEFLQVVSANLPIAARAWITSHGPQRCLLSLACLLLAALPLANFSNHKSGGLRGMVARTRKVRDSFCFSMDFAGALQLSPVVLALRKKPPFLSGFLLEHVDGVAGVNQLPPSPLGDEPPGRQLHLFASGEFVFRLEEKKIRRNRSRATH